jgi:hypothetical protein
MISYLHLFVTDEEATAMIETVPDIKFVEGINPIQAIKDFCVLLPNIQAKVTSQLTGNVNVSSFEFQRRTLNVYGG